MPRKDPITGCMVMTHAEFLSTEAESKGTTPEAIMSDLMAEMAEANAFDTQQLRLRALENIQDLAQKDRKAWSEDETYHQENGLDFKEPKPPFPLQLVEILEAHSHSGMTNSTTTLRVRVLCDDGVIREAHAWSASYSGGFYEPPSEDETLTWTNPDGSTFTYEG